MPAVCLRHTEIPNTSKLFADFVSHFDRLARFYRHEPLSPDALRSAAETAAAAYPDSRREALVAALLEQNGPSAALDRLAEPGSVALPVSLAASAAVHRKGTINPTSSPDYPRLPLVWCTNVASSLGGLVFTFTHVPGASALVFAQNFCCESRHFGAISRRFGHAGATA